MRSKTLWVSGLLFAAMLSFGRILLLLERNQLRYNGELLQGIAADMCFAWFIIAMVCLTKKIHGAIPYLVSLPVLLLFLSNMEYIYALGDVVNVQDLFYAADGQFLQGTFSHLSFPLYSVLLFCNLLFLILSADGRRTLLGSYRINGKHLLMLGIVLFTLETGVIYLMGNNWKTVNFAQASLYNGMNAVLYRDEVTFSEFPSDIESRVYGSSQIGNGNWLLSQKDDRPKNILIIAMEGIPGAYLQANQQYLGTSNPIQFASLERIKDQTLVVPNFLTHNNQTIRGLYSLLSGTYPKLDASTPYAYEYIQNPESVRMLPEELKDRGYRTAYIQAAPLDYMSKDQFMHTAGFDTIIGSEGFRSSIPFGWGIDDGAFLEQIPEYLEELNRGGEPWFATLLTVGTHHPYAVPDDLEKEYPDRKEASVRYLDQSLNKLIDYLETSEVGKDTLVVFTSDESHGVTDQPYGSNWGLCLVYSPSIQGEIINKGVYGLKDLKGSILDYVDSNVGSTSRGRSIFRNYSKEESILFASHYSGDVYFSAVKGEVYQLDRRNRLYLIQSENRQLFSQRYTKTRITDPTIKQSLLLYKQYINLPLTDSQELVITSNKEYEAGWGEQVSISGGQYLTLPAKTYVTIRLEYQFVNPNEGDELIFYLDAEMNPDREGRKTVTSSMAGPGTLEYTFYNEKEWSSYYFTLRAGMFASAGILKVDRLSVVFSNEQPEKGPETMEYD